MDEHGPVAQLGTAIWNMSGEPTSAGADLRRDDARATGGPAVKQGYPQRSFKGRRNGSQH